MTRVTNNEYFILHGAEEIKALFKQLPDKVGNRIQRKAMKSVVEKLLVDVAARTPVKTGELRGSLTTKIRKKKVQVIGQVIATAPHAHLIEYGWVHTGHAPKKKPTSAGHIPGRKFMRGAIGAQAESILDEFQTSLQESAQEAVEKL